MPAGVVTPRNFDRPETAYDLLGIEKQQGAIRVGLAGDMIAVPENPLSNIEVLRKVDFVLKDGEVIRRP